MLEDAQDVQAAQEADGAAVAEMSLGERIDDCQRFYGADETVYILRIRSISVRDAERSLAL